MVDFIDADFMHPPGAELNWQESVVLLFGDTTTGLTGYFRVGTQPNAQICQEWIYLQLPDGTRFRRLRFDLPIDALSRRPDGFAAGGLHWAYDGDRIVLRAVYDSVRVHLEYRDFYPATPCWKWIGRDHVDIGAAAHYESSGFVQGTVEVGGRRHSIGEGFAHRDHSWGTRNGSNLRACRWCVGTAGPQFSHSIFTFFDANGGIAMGGWIVRNGNVEHARQIDSIVFNNMDGITVRGGRVSALLESGERIDIEIETLSSFITGHDTDHGGPNSYVCSEGVSLMRSGELVGAGCLTVCNNVTGVGEPVQRVCEEFSTLIDGVSWAPRASPLIRVRP
jgi:hypothetical protein